MVGCAQENLAKKVKTEKTLGRGQMKKRAILQQQKTLNWLFI